MIKCWKGLEEETVFDEHDLMTLFVCADTPVSADTIISLLSANKDVKSLYLGAGRVEFNGVLSEKDWSAVVSYCKTNSIRIVIEVSAEKLNSFISLYNSELVTFIVVYYGIPEEIDNVYFKTDDFSVTRLFTMCKKVDVTNLTENMYPNDIVVYKED